MDGEYVAGEVPREGCGRRWLCRNRAGEIIFGKWLRPLRHGRKRLAMVQRLVSARLLRAAGEDRRRRAQPTRSGFIAESRRTYRSEACSSRLLLSLQRSILLVLYHCHPWER